MMFIKVDNDITLEEVCEAISMEPKALINPMRGNVLNVILRDKNDKTHGEKMVYTNITMPIAETGLTMRNGVPYGEISKDISGISLYIDETHNDIIDQVMNGFHDNKMVAMMAQL